MSDGISAKIMEVIQEQLDLEQGVVRMESRFVEDLRADSLAVAEILLLVEEIYDVILDDEEMDNIKTVQDAVDYIKARKRPRHLHPV